MKNEWQDKQLAAARDEAEKFARLCRGFKADIWTLEQQLAAERENLIIVSRTIGDLRQQLAAEREKLAAAEVTIREYEDYIKELDEIALKNKW